MENTSLRLGSRPQVLLNMQNFHTSYLGQPIPFVGLPYVWETRKSSPWLFSKDAPHQIAWSCSTMSFSTCQNSCLSRCVGVPITVRPGSPLQLRLGAHISVHFFYWAALCGTNTKKKVPETLPEMHQTTWCTIFFMFPTHIDVNLAWIELPQKHMH